MTINVGRHRAQARIRFSPTSTASNLGVPANSSLSYYQEVQPDGYSYVANPAGLSYVDDGVGAFLTQIQLLSQPSVPDANWLPLAPQNVARFQVPTLRNVDKRPYALQTNVGRKLHFQEFNRRLLTNRTQ